MHKIIFIRHRVNKLDSIGLEPLFAVPNVGTHGTGLGWVARMTFTYRKSMINLQNTNEFIEGGGAIYIPGHPLWYHSYISTIR